MDNIENLRIIIFVSLAVLFTILELLIPSYPHLFNKRVLNNLSLMLGGALITKLAFPYGLIVIAQKTPLQSWHLNQLPLLIELPVTLLIFDFAIYWQHRFSHRWKWFWHFHAVHHSDQTLDVSSAVRFHPGEILISNFYKLVLISLLAPRWESYFCYEILLSSMAIFNHSNVQIPKRFEKVLRLLIVTPQMHYPHHSPVKQLTNSNFGNTFSFWDRLFHTYTSQENDSFGLDDFPQESFKRIWGYPLEYDIFKRNQKDR